MRDFTSINRQPVSPLHTLAFKTLLAATCFIVPICSAQDSDGDLLDDSVESQLGTNPALADTDGDGLTDGYEVGVGRYELRNLQNSTHEQARIAAQAAGGALATWSRPGEFEAFSAAAAAGFARTGFVWVDATAPADTWQWPDGSPVAEALFSGDEFNDTDSGEIFAYADNRSLAISDSPFRFALWSGGGSGSANAAGYLLEFGDYTDPLDADSDDDGLTDGDEVNALATDPNLADTDKDGLTDGYEAGVGRYELRNLQNSTYEQARLAAQAAGGALATWSRPGEFEAFSAAATAFVRTGFVWVDATAPAGPWQWPDGSLVAEALFAGNEFADTDSGEIFAYADNRSLAISNAPFRFALWSGGAAGSANAAGYLLEFGDYTDPLDEDSDDDGLTDGSEVNDFHTDPNDASSPPVRDLRLDHAVEISFISATDKSYQVEASPDGESWTPVGTPLEGTGDRIGQVINVEGEPRMLFRVIALP